MDAAVRFFTICLFIMAFGLGVVLLGHVGENPITSFAGIMVMVFGSFGVAASLEMAEDKKDDDE